MHIYRVAAELGLLKLDYMDHALASRVDNERSQEETGRLRQLPRNTSEWGDWAAEIHESFVQKNRQWRGYRDLYAYKLVAQDNQGAWTVNNWPVRLTECACPDFDERKLPCKHIYAVALCSRIALPLSLSEYEEATARGEELFFHPWGKTCCKIFPTA